MNVQQMLSKADHFAGLASRAAYQAATCPHKGDREQWEDRAARYDASAAQYRLAARRAA